MSNDYLNTEVDKIINDSQLPFPQNLAMASVWIMGNMKGINLKVLEVTALTSLADFFTLASATNKTQAQSMADEIVGQFKRHNIHCYSVEGMSSSDWILLDFRDILVHIFSENARHSFDLDGLWSPARLLSIPQAYYFSTPESYETPSDRGEEKKYF
jgi:ribosome-associated protein